MPKYLANFPLPLILHLLYIGSKISFSSLSLLLTVHNSIPQKIVSFFFCCRCNAKLSGQCFFLNYILSINIVLFRGKTEIEDTNIWNIKHNIERIIYAIP